MTVDQTGDAECTFKQGFSVYAERTLPINASYILGITSRIVMGKAAFIKNTSFHQEIGIKYTEETSEMLLQ